MSLLGPKYVVKFYIWKDHSDDRFGTFDGKKLKVLLIGLKACLEDYFIDIKMKKIVKGVHPTEKNFKGIIRDELLKQPNSWCVGIFVPEGFEAVDRVKNELKIWLDAIKEDGYVLTDEKFQIIEYL